MDNTTAIALSRLVAQQRAMDVTASNIANANTPGYKAERVLFADWLSRQPTGDTREASFAYVQDRATYRSFAEGPISHTANPLDLALGSDGFFTVSTSGGPRLTRAGRFALQPDGSVEDGEGHALLDVGGQPIRVGPTDTTLQVASDGTLSSQNGPLARIGVVTVRDPNRLTAEGNRLLRADTPTTPDPAPRITQGAVEDSNVQPIAETNRMMAALRQFQFVSQLVEAEGQREQAAIDKLTTPRS